MKILVTGGAGKAGRFVLKELAAVNHELFNIDRVMPSEPVPGRFNLVDLTDYGEVVDAFAQFKPEAVCHVAANPSPSGFPRHQTFANNTLSTYHVMEAAGDNGVQRLVYASSEMATGWLTTEELPPKFPFDEEDRVASPNAYALSKYLGEVIAESMVARYPDMSICSLRINNIIMPDNYSRLKERRENFPLGSGNFWSYIDVRDVASAFRAAVEGESSGHEVFLIAAADTCLEMPIQDAVAQVYGSGANFFPDHGPHKSAFDCNKIRRYFGWEPAYSWRS